MYKRFFAVCLVLSIMLHAVVAALIINHRSYPKDFSGVSIQEVDLVGGVAASLKTMGEVLKGRPDGGVLRTPQAEESTGSKQKNASAKPSTASGAVNAVPDKPGVMQDQGRANGTAEEGRGTASSSSSYAGTDTRGGNKEGGHTDLAMADSGPTGIVKARLINRPDIRYDETSRRRGEEGSVSISLEVDKSGNPRNVRLKGSSGYPRLDRVALNGIRGSRFSPSLLNGRPVDSEIEYTVIFRLDEESSDLSIVEDNRVNVIK